MELNYSIPLFNSKSCGFFLMASPFPHSSIFSILALFYASRLTSLQGPRKQEPQSFQEDIFSSALSKYEILKTVVDFLTLSYSELSKTEFPWGTFPPTSSLSTWTELLFSYMDIQLAYPLPSVPLAPYAVVQTDGKSSLAEKLLASPLCTIQHYYLHIDVSECSPRPCPPYCIVARAPHGLLSFLSLIISLYSLGKAVHAKSKTTRSWTKTALTVGKVQHTRTFYIFFPNKGSTLQTKGIKTKLNWNSRF